MAQTQEPRAADPAARALIVFLALIGLVVGQAVLYSMSDTQVWGVPLSVASAALLIWGLSGRLPRWLTSLVSRLHLSIRTLLIAAAIGLSVTATLLDVTYEQRDIRDYAPVLLVWLLSLGLYIAAFVDSPPIDWRSWWVAHRRELGLVAVITLIGAGLRLYQLGQLPRVINGDEGLIGQFALGTNQNPLANPFSLFENIGGLYMEAIGLSLQLFGRTSFALRLMPALGGILAIPALYLLARHLFNRRVAFLAATFLTFSHVHIHFSRTVAVSYIQGTWLVPLEMYFFVTGLERRSAWRMSLAAVIVAVHFSVYLSAQIIIPFFLVYLLIAALIARPIDRNAGGRRVFWRSALGPIAASAFGVVLMALPQLAYGVRHPDLFLARLNAEGTLQSGWLASEAARTGLSETRILLDRLAHTFLTLVHYPVTDFYNATIPLLGIVTSVLFMIGLLIALWRTRDHRYLLLNGYFWAFTVSIALFSIPPSADAYRMLTALPAALLMAAIGLNELLGWLGSIVQHRRQIQLATAAAILVAMAGVNVRAYYLDFAGHCRYGDGFGTRFASYLGEYLGTLPRQTTVYLLSDDNLRYGTHMSVDFLSRNLPVKNQPGPASEIRSEAGLAVIAIPGRAAELREWVHEHPGGELHREYDCDQLMLEAYRLPGGG